MSCGQKAGEEIRMSVVEDKVGQSGPDAAEAAFLASFCVQREPKGNFICVLKHQQRVPLGKGKQIWQL